MKAAAAVVIAILFAGCSRAPQPKPKQAAPPPEIHVTQFYASPAAVPRGEVTNLCYGVENAQSVRIEPPAGDTWPSPNRCVQTHPNRTTTYRLVASRSGAPDVVRSVTVQVLPPQPGHAATPVAGEGGRGMIRLFLSSASEVARGQSSTLCYEVEGAESYRIEPAGPALPSAKGCIVVQPPQTTTYTLTASGKGGATEHEQVRIVVH